MATTTSFVEELLSSVPELKNPYEAHVRDNDALLPHVFFGDVARFALDEARKSERTSALSRLLNHLERGLSNENEEIRELIAVSFVENLCGEAALEPLKPLMGPNLEKEVETICGY